MASSGFRPRSSGDNLRSEFDQVCCLAASHACFLTLYPVARLAAFVHGLETSVIAKHRVIFVVYPADFEDSQQQQSYGQNESLETPC